MAASISLTFQTNLGAELPCITQNSVSLTEAVTFGSISLAPVYFRVQQYANAPVKNEQCLKVRPLHESFIARRNERIATLQVWSRCPYLKLRKLYLCLLEIHRLGIGMNPKREEVPVCVCCRRAIAFSSECPPQPEP
jgi:hypothetical protein